MAQGDVRSDVSPGVFTIRQNTGNANAAQLALDQNTRAGQAYLRRGATIVGGKATNAAAPLAGWRGDPLLGLETLAYDPELAFQTELLNLGANFEAFLAFDGGMGMGGMCGGFGGSGESEAANNIAQKFGEGNGATGDQSRSNSIWDALQRSLFRSRTKFQTSMQSVPEEEDQLFAPALRLPRALSIRKLRKQ
jgi:hypothetical protein